MTTAPVCGGEAHRPDRPRQPRGDPHRRRGGERSRRLGRRPCRRRQRRPANGRHHRRAHGGNNERDSSGSAYVVFGQRSTATIDLASLGGGGFRIDGAAQGDVAGFSVSAAGDVNGDGLADVVVGAPEADNNLREQSGSAYVVFGQRTTAPVDLSALGGRGFRIDGASGSEFAGWSVADAGDVNGDKRRDVLVGAPFAANDELDIAPEGFERSQAGSLYVVFGRAAATNVDLAALGNRGFRIEGPEQVSRVGWSAARAGDVNRDGRSDVLVGAPFTSSNERVFSGFGLRRLREELAGDRRPCGARSARPPDRRGRRGRDRLRWSRLVGRRPGRRQRRRPSRRPHRRDGGGCQPAGGLRLRVRRLRPRTGAGRPRGASQRRLPDRRRRRVRLRGQLRLGRRRPERRRPGGRRGERGASRPERPRRLRLGVRRLRPERRRRRIDLAKLGKRGLRLDGAAADDLTGWSVSGVGDMNGESSPISSSERRPPARRSERTPAPPTSRSCPTSSFPA